MKQLVIGLGESGLAMIRHAVHVGTDVSAYDSRENPAQLSALQHGYPDIVIFCGVFKTEYLEGVTEIAISPGLSPHTLPLKEILAVAVERNISIVGELDLFVRALNHLQATNEYTPKILAVTGTNGKTTVTALTRHLCESAGVTVVAAGNISPSMLDAWCDALEAQSLPDVWVLELSSFQLQFVHGFNPHAATVLNISQDHLDWHIDMDEYIEAKAKIFGTQTVQILNRDDAVVMQMARQNSVQMSFGINKPAFVDEYGLWRDGAMDWLSMAHIDTHDEVHKKRGKSIQVEVSIDVQRLMPADALKIRGRHNAMNALAALSLCRAIHLPLAKLLHGLRTYTGEPHRVQFITHVNGVDFYDDSKGTNVGATLAALQGLGQPIVLVAGGDGKGQDFSPLLDAVRAHVKRIDLIGKDALMIKESLSITGVDIYTHSSLEQAAMAAAQAAQPGQAVLLSPACASLDMFNNYEHRAEVFIETVREWAQSQGQI